MVQLDGQGSDVRAGKCPATAIQKSSHHQSRRDQLALMALALTVASIVIHLSCSLHTRQKWVTFFFDVPVETPVATDGAHPNDSSTGGSNSTTKIRTVRSVSSAKPTSIHPPYLERQCAACHEPENRMAVSAKVMDECNDCHERYFSDEVGHVPVARKQCLTCHEPHLSWEPHLLSRNLFKTCMQCHKKPENLSPEFHAGEDVQSCTKCHDPHFGSGFLLKQGKPGEPSTSAKE